MKVRDVIMRGKKLANETSNILSEDELLIELQQLYERVYYDLARDLRRFFVAEAVLALAKAPNFYALPKDFHAILSVENQGNDDLGGLFLGHTGKEYRLEGDYLQVSGGGKLRYVPRAVMLDLAKDWPDQWTVQAADFYVYGIAYRLHLLRGTERVKDFRFAMNGAYDGFRSQVQRDLGQNPMVLETEAYLELGF